MTLLCTKKSIIAAQQTHRKIVIGLEKLLFKNSMFLIKTRNDVWDLAGLEWIFILLLDPLHILSIVYDVCSQIPS